MCNSYTMGSSALPDIYCTHQPEGHRQEKEEFWLKFNPTIIACLIPYIREEDHSITSKKSDDFWRQCALLLGVPYLKLMRYTHWQQCRYLVKTVLNEIYMHCLNEMRYMHCLKEIYYPCVRIAVHILSRCNMRYICTGFPLS